MTRLNNRRQKQKQKHTTWTSINNLQTIQNDNLVVSVDTDFATSNIVLVSVTDTNGQPVDIKYVIHFVGSDDLVGATLASSYIATPPVKGWINGTYDVTIYSLYYKNIHQDNGRLVTEDV